MHVHDNVLNFGILVGSCETQFVDTGLSTIDAVNEVDLVLFVKDISQGHIGHFKRELNFASEKKKFVGALGARIILGRTDIDEPRK